MASSLFLRPRIRYETFISLLCSLFEQNNGLSKAEAPNEGLLNCGHARARASLTTRGSGWLVLIVIAMDELIIIIIKTKPKVIKLWVSQSWGIATRFEVEICCNRDSLRFEVMQKCQCT